MVCRFREYNSVYILKTAGADDVSAPADGYDGSAGGAAAKCRFEPALKIIEFIIIKGDQILC